MKKVASTKNVTYSEFLEFRVQDVVSDNVKYFIYQSGFTAEELSYRSNLSVATINRLKAGEHLSFRGICALAEALNKDPLAFFAEKKEA
ncbi:MAG: helix-turn-helix transcriptional regulator [Treponema sp.]|nr:helix-turn-helix transcriptional regulator [Treponema sp.]